MDDINKLKLELLDKFPELVYRVIKYKFQNTDKDEPEPSTPEDFFNIIQKLLVFEMNTPDNEAEWKTIIVDLIDAINDLKSKMKPGLPVTTSKRQGAIFYDRWILFTNKLKGYVVDMLGF